MTNKTYFDSKYFAKDLYRQIPDRELVLSQANELSKTEFIQWVKDYFGDSTIESSVADLILCAYDESWCSKEDILGFMQEQIDSVVKAQNKAKAEILRLKALLA